jgi:hypothetical protein
VKWGNGKTGREVSRLINAVFTLLKPLAPCTIHLLVLSSPVFCPPDAFGAEAYGP